MLKQYSNFIPLHRKKYLGRETYIKYNQKHIKDTSLGIFTFRTSVFAISFLEATHEFAAKLK